MSRSNYRPGTAIVGQPSNVSVPTLSPFDGIAVLTNGGAGRKNQSVIVTPGTTDHQTHSIQTQTVIAKTPAGDGLLMNAAQITGRHFVGAPSTDTSAVMQNNGGIAVLLYTRTSLEYQGNFNSSGNLKTSTTFNSQVPNSSAFITDFTLNFSSSGVTPNISMKFWYDNGSGADAHIYIPNFASTTGDRDINVSHSTSASPTSTLSGLTSGQNIFVCMYWNGSSMQSVVQTSALSISQVRTAFQDGGYVVQFSQATTPVTTAGSTGSHSGNGGRTF